MKKREVKPYSKRKTVIVLILGTLGLFLAFGCFILGSILQENGYDTAIYVTCYLSFLPICILDIAFLLYHQKGIILRDIEKELNRTKNSNIDILNTNINIEEKLQDKKFKRLDQGYYYKRIFNFNKDYINYYFKRVVSNEIDKTIKEEVEYFENCCFKKNNKCFILFIDKNEVKSEDLDIIFNLSNYIISSEVVPVSNHDTLFIVLTDTIKDTSYCVKPGSNKLSFYNISYKFVKKLLKKEK